MMQAGVEEPVYLSGLVVYYLAVLQVAYLSDPLGAEAVHLEHQYAVVCQSLCSTVLLKSEPVYQLFEFEFQMFLAELNVQSPVSLLSETRV